MTSRFTSVYNKEADTGKGEPTAFHTRKSVEFYKMNSISYRAEISQTADGRLYVSLGRYWLCPQSSSWIPTKKQMFMPVAAWRNMKQAISFIDDGLDEVMPVNTASKCGMLLIYYLLPFSNKIYYIRHCSKLKFHFLFLSKLNLFSDAL